MSIIMGAAGCFDLLELIFVREKLTKRRLFFAEWRDEDEVTLVDVVNSDSGFRFGRARDGWNLELKTKRGIDIFPTRDKFQQHVSMLQLLVVGADQISFFQL